MECVLYSLRRMALASSELIPLADLAQLHKSRRNCSGRTLEVAANLFLGIANIRETRFSGYRDDANRRRNSPWKKAAGTSLRITSRIYFSAFCVTVFFSACSIIFSSVIIVFLFSLYSIRQPMAIHKETTLARALADDFCDCAKADRPHNSPFPANTTIGK